MYSCVIRSWEVLRERYLTGIFSWANKVGGSFLWAGGGYAQFWWPQEGQGPLPMVGYEARRDGVEDYRYLQMLEDCVAANPDDRLAVEAGAQIIVVQSTVTTARHISNSYQGLSFSDLVETVKVPVLIGNTVTASATLEIMEQGIDGILVGVGPGAACTTRDVTGVGVPLAVGIMSVPDSSWKSAKPPTRAPTISPWAAFSNRAPSRARRPRPWTPCAKHAAASPCRWWRSARV